MQNFQDTFETCKQLFINTFSIGMTAPLILFFRKYKVDYLPIRTLNQFDRK